MYEGWCEEHQSAACGYCYRLNITWRYTSYSGTVYSTQLDGNGVQVVASDLGPAVNWATPQRAFHTQWFRTTRRKGGSYTRISQSKRTFFKAIGLNLRTTSAGCGDLRNVSVQRAEYLEFAVGSPASLLSKSSKMATNGVFGICCWQPSQSTSKSSKMATRLSLTTRTTKCTLYPCTVTASLT